MKYNLEASERKSEILDEYTRRVILDAQRNEITEHFVYEKLSKSTKDQHNREILEGISRDELEHHDFWRKYTKKNVKPDRLKIWKYFLASRLFGLTFGIKLMEKGEEEAQVTYEKISRNIPDAVSIVEDEDEHEKQLLDLIDEEHLQYLGSVVLGLNDALVELTGAIAGLTFALRNAELITLTGSITGIAGALSMAASEYLSTKAEEGARNPLKASLYTGSAYILTVLLIIFPFLALKNLYFSLGLSILNGILVILVFTFYVSVTNNIPFRRRFFETLSISLGVAGLTFIIGFLVRIFWNIEV